MRGTSSYHGSGRSSSGALRRGGSRVTTGGSTFKTAARIGVFVIVLFAITNFLVIFLVSSSRTKNHSLFHTFGGSLDSPKDDDVRVDLLQLRHVFEALGSNSSSNSSSTTAGRERRNTGELKVDGHEQPVLLDSLKEPSNISYGSSRHHSRQSPFLTSNFRWDNQHLYKIHEFVHVGSQFERWSSNPKTDRRVTLATHASPDRLHWASIQALVWDGPISVAVFTPGFDFAHLAFLLEFLFRCFPEFEAKSAIHIVYPAKSPPVSASEAELRSFKSKLGNPACEHAPAPGFAKRLKGFVTAITIGREQGRPSPYRALANPYPQNHLRNIARKTSPTDYVSLLDIDVVPSPGAALSLSTFFRDLEIQHKSRGSSTSGDIVRPDSSVFVLPTYELAESLKSIPKTKADLIRLGRKGLAQPYHVQVFPPNQFATNFSLWEQNVDEGPVRISHEVEDPQFFYEPFYVSSDVVPPHDERYIGYGFTRNTQVLETKLAGFKFYVLTPIFTCHWGLYKDRRSAKRPAWRERQNNHNNKLFQQAKKELTARYGRVVR